MSAAAQRHWREIPVVINNRDRLEYLRLLIEWLERIGMERLFIIDNGSTYEPLLEYYETSLHTVVRSNENGGFLSFWELPIHREFIDDYYVYTDPDVVPREDCPHDVMEVLLDALNRYPDIEKAGFGLEIGDLPASIPYRSQILEVERPYWTKRRDERFFEASIDTTYALYRPHARGGSWIPSLRSDYPYVARHMPWYRSPEEWTQEDAFYAPNAKMKTHWTQVAADLRGS